MATKDHVALLKEGVKVWNEWRAANPGIKPELAGADLLGANLREANLLGANLRVAHLSGADLRRADLRGADVSGADLLEAHLSRANFNKAYLRGADLRSSRLHGADLREANLTGGILCRADLRAAHLSRANLSEANMSECSMGGTELGDVDLSHCKGLETIQHEGPSSIGIDTIYRSRGNIPDVFLRGAGVPDNFIEYMHSLAGIGFEYYSCFISYSSKNQGFAERLYADLQAKGVRCWFAPHEGQAGRKLHEQIDEAIRLHEKLLLILSEDSIKSEWVKTEIRKAAKRQGREKKDVLFPVSLIPFAVLREWECFDADLGKDLAAEVREYLTPDFSQWETDHDSYKKALEKLLRDLKSGKTKQGAAGA